MTSLKTYLLLFCNRIVSRSQTTGWLEFQLFQSFLQTKNGEIVTNFSHKILTSTSNPFNTANTDIHEPVWASPPSRRRGAGCGSRSWTPRPTPAAAAAWSRTRRNTARTLGWGPGEGGAAASWTWWRGSSSPPGSARATVTGGCSPHRGRRAWWPTPPRSCSWSPPTNCPAGAPRRKTGMDWDYR